MPPKKNVNKNAETVKKPKENVPKARIKKEKPKLKTPSIVKVKISPTGLKKNSSPVKNNPENPVLSDTEVKNLLFERMNEVATAQLVKDRPVNIEKDAVVKKKRGRKKKIQTEPQPDPDLSSADTETTIPKKKIQTEPQPDPDLSSADTETTIPKKKIQTEPQPDPYLSSADTETTIPKKKPRTKATAKVPVKDKIVVKKPAALKKVPKVTKPPIKRRTLKRTSEMEKKKCTRSNKAAGDDSPITSPSILNEKLTDRLPKAVQKPEVPVINNTDSRRTSLTDNGSEFSWNISGSSTTTCITVCSRDIVRIDGKVPVVKLNHIDCDFKVEPSQEKKEIEQHTLSKDSSISSSSSSSSYSSSSSSSSESVLGNTRDLSLSSVTTRSPTYTPNNASPKTKIHLDKLASKLDRLEAKLESFDLSFANWADNDQDYDYTKMKPFEVKIYKVMEEEHGVLRECNFLSQILADQCFAPAKEPVEEQKVGENPEHVEPEDGFAKPDASLPCVTVKPVESRIEPPSEYPARRDSMSFEPADDDDALSLFAESITGTESSRVSSSAPEEYVPLPLRPPPAARDYRPSKIDELPKTKPVCEKQNADSTSIHREPEVPSTSREPSRLGGPQPLAEPQPQLTVSQFLSAHGTKCYSLRGVCFFNMISNCKKVNCTFGHNPLEVDVVGQRITKLGEEQFIQEYMSISKWPRLRIKYGLCFIRECQRRELPRILVEMVIVYISKVNPVSKEDGESKVEVMESALMYLNKVNLGVCEEPLKYRFDDGKTLCEAFMEVIVGSQNFGRFRAVFLSLAAAALRTGRPLRPDVAAQVLERVCILAADGALATVLLSILERTDAAILEHPMIGILESELDKRHAALAARLRALRRRPGTARYTSPDTTHLDNMNKPVEPTFTRTINWKKIQSLNEAPRSTFKRLSQNWNNRTIYDKIPRLPLLPLPPPRPLLGKRPLGLPAQYGQRPFKYPRTSGPDFYGNQ